MNSFKTIALTLGLGAILAAACGDLRDGVVQPQLSQEPLTYGADIRPILQSCTSCHAGGGAEGQYDLTTIVGLVGGGTDDVPNALPGDATSRILQVIASGDHAGYIGSNAEALRKWVVVDSMNMAQPDVHPTGWLDPASDGFHGRALKAANWNLAECRTCHGENYEGGISKASCLTCHTDSPEDCATCHGTAVSPAPPLDVDGNFSTTNRGVGAHQAHLNTESGLFTGVPCGDCHTVPQSVDAAGHIDSDLPAEVTLGGLAVHEGHPASWDGMTCNNTYCHGNAQPTWTNVGAGEAACGTCHTLPPQTPLHPAVTSCDPCHGQVVDVNTQIKDPTLHINGNVEVMLGHPDGFASSASPNFHGAALRRNGWNLEDCQVCHGDDFRGSTVAPTCTTCHSQGPDDCAVCHGSVASPAPPSDLDGNTATTARGVGAHQAHLTASTNFAAVPCSECHRVPSAWNSGGHLDTSLPAELTFGALATTGGRTPTYDGMTCGNTYCHGDATPTWTNVGAGEAACGTCHGAPPGGDHPPVQNCALCHERVAGENQTIINPSLHMNGVIDLGP